MPFPRQPDDKLFYHIARSHMYWGRKDIDGLRDIFKDTGLKKGGVFLDPFCGGGTAVLTALSLGARALASDLNPMAVFITKMLIQPTNRLALQDAFEKIKSEVKSSIQENYRTVCPKCRKKGFFDFLKWGAQKDTDYPVKAKINCSNCGYSELVTLEKREIRRQLNLANIQPTAWYPKRKIHSRRKIKFKYFYEFFTPRNLASLAKLLQAIEKVPTDEHKEILRYVFTGMLYSCSIMQMFSEDEPSSSHGWTAPRFYLPTERQEKNVWKAFETRFKTVLDCKKKTNTVLDFLQLSDSIKSFEASDDTAYIYKADSLSFSFPRNLPVNHVFLDPPYKDDIDYLNFSEFWGSWLKMKFDIKRAWNPGSLSDEENAEKFSKILMRIKDNTDRSCVITLAFGAKHDWMREAVSKTGYELHELNPILYDNSLKRGQRRKKERRNFSSIGQYFLIKPKERKKREAKTLFSEEDKNKLKFWMRIASFLYINKHEKHPNPETVRREAIKFIPPELRPFIKELKRPEIKEWTEKPKLNRNAYHLLCLSFTHSILSKENYKIASASASQFEKYELQNFYSAKKLPLPQGLAKGADFEFNKKGLNLIFCFYDKKDTKWEKALKRISERIKKNDHNKFENICFLVLPSNDLMNEYRRINWADNWQRGFFVSFEELAEKAGRINAREYGHFKSSPNNMKSDHAKEIKIFDAKVLKNTPVGPDADTHHFKIKFEAQELQNVVPGQFVMVDTKKRLKKQEKHTPRVLNSFSDLRRHSSDKMFHPVSYIKRPFSIHRAFYEHFEKEYIKNISLPPDLATIAHTVFPHKFDIFYKVIEEGVGTNELKSLKDGDTLQMLGPLGQSTKLADLRLEEFKEVHLIGGGVGMAPLVFFGQGLKYYSFNIKAFIGIQNASTLQYLDKSFEEEPENSYVYIDDLLNIGLKKDEIHISLETEKGSHNLRSKVPKENCHKGFVSEQYESYLKNMEGRNKILSIVCGPTPMTKALENITTKHKIKMKVLMEKKMGCGIGVCMSCVCPTKKNNLQQYSRVCVDGPLFDAECIDWEKI